MHGTAFRARYDSIKADRKFGYIYLVLWKRPEQIQWTEYSVAVILDFQRKKNMNSLYNAHPKHSKMAAGDWNLTDAKTCCKANRHPSYKSLVDCYDKKLLYFVHSTLCLKMDTHIRDTFELNSTEHKHLGQCRGAANRGRFDLIEIRS